MEESWKECGPGSIGIIPTHLTFRSRMRYGLRRSKAALATQPLSVRAKPLCVHWVSPTAVTARRSRAAQEAAWEDESIELYESVDDPSSGKSGALQTREPACLPHDCSRKLSSQGSAAKPFAEGQLTTQSRVYAGDD
jgi:hypothetical protein